MNNDSTSPQGQDTGERGSDVCPDCGGELVPTHWLASVGEYPVKEVVKIPGKRCKACNYSRFEYDPHAPKDSQP